MKNRYDEILEKYISINDCNLLDNELLINTDLFIVNIHDINFC